MKMKTPSFKTLWIAFVIGSLSPIFAMVVKPVHHSFYMFLPATPHTTISRIRLFVGDTVLVFGFIVTLLAAIMLAVHGIKEKRYLQIMCILVVFANPLQQPIFLESLDTRLNKRLRDRAEQLQIIGKTPDQIQDLFGKPILCGTFSAPSPTIDRDGNVTWQDETYTEWEYKPLPLYWIGSRLEVFFVDGKVKHFETE